MVVDVNIVYALASVATGPVASKQANSFESKIYQFKHRGCILVQLLFLTLVMAWDTLQSLGILATGTAAVGLMVRYGVKRFSEVVEQGIDRYSAVVEQGVAQSAEVAEQGIQQFFETRTTQHEAEIEAHRSMSSGFDEHRMKVIRELYHRFVKFERDIRALHTGTAMETTPGERLCKATKSGNAFSTYYRSHKIYFPPDTCDAIENARDAMTEVLDEVHAQTPHGEQPRQEAGAERTLADWRVASGDNMPERKHKLETHLRALLGVDIDRAE